MLERWMLKTVSVLRSVNRALCDVVTTRLIGETAPARAPTVRLMMLSLCSCSAESAVTEDIPSSMPPEGTPA